MAQTAEQKRQYFKAWREANKERMAEHSRRFRERNPDKVSATVKAWREENPEQVRALVRKGAAKRRRLKADGPIDNGITAQAVAKRDDMVCAECQCIVEPHPGGYLASGWTIGHIVPLSKGGTHTWDNVQCECHSCNASKGANQ